MTLPNPNNVSAHDCCPTAVISEMSLLNSWWPSHGGVNIVPDAKWMPLDQIVGKKIILGNVEGG
jgi:hypothetical protein